MLFVSKSRLEGLLSDYYGMPKKMRENLAKALALPLTLTASQADWLPGYMPSLIMVERARLVKGSGAAPYVTPDVEVLAALMALSLEGPFTEDSAYAYFSLAANCFPELQQTMKSSDIPFGAFTDGQRRIVEGFRRGMATWKKGHIDRMKWKQMKSELEKFSLSTEFFELVSEEGHL